MVVTPQSHCQMISLTLLVLQGEGFVLVVVMGSVMSLQRSQHFNCS